MSLIIAFNLWQPTSYSTLSRGGPGGLGLPGGAGTQGQGLSGMGVGVAGAAGGGNGGGAGGGGPRDPGGVGVGGGMYLPQQQQAAQGAGGPGGQRGIPDGMSYPADILSIVGNKGEQPPSCLWLLPKPMHPCQRISTEVYARHIPCTEEAYGSVRYKATSLIATDGIFFLRTL